MSALDELGLRVESEARARMRLGRLITQVIARLSIIDIELQQRLNQLEARIAMLEAYTSEADHGQATAELEQEASEAPGR